MKKLLVLFLALLFLFLLLVPASATEEEADPYLENAQPYGGHLYALIDMTVTWSDAKLFCESLGGHLATVTTAEEQTFVESLLSAGTKDVYWLGAQRIDGDFSEWVTGEDFLYTHWAAGQPDNGRGIEDSLMIYANRVHGANVQNFWNDLPDSGFWAGNYFRVGIICEWDYACISAEGYSISHSFSEWQTDRVADCRSAGAQSRVCGTCGVREENILPQLIHPYTAFETISGSVVIPPIVKERQCTVCGHVDHVEDFGYVWVSVLAAVAAVGLCIGVISYIRAFRRR